jgi:hypothetical protein|tara:strand:- start:1680 stop:2132 length:453 start_codon:yes stop_codon:yes gene_type:complete
MKSCEIYDNFLEPDLLDYCHKYFRNDTHFKFQKSDKVDSNFFLMGLPPHDCLIDFIFFKIKIVSQRKLELLRFYTNLQFSNMDTDIHTDDGKVTCLFMIAGQGDFQLNNEKIPFKENRLILFDAGTPHKGHPPDTGYRITLAYKTNEIFN